MYHPGCGTHGATQKIGWRFPVMAGGQPGDPGVHQGRFHLVPHHLLGSSPTAQGPGSSITPMDTFSQLPALRGIFNSTKHSVHRADSSPASPPAPPDRQHLPGTGCCAKAGKAGCGLNANTKTNVSGGNMMTSPAVSGNICQVAGVISWFAAHISGTSYHW